MINMYDEELLKEVDKDLNKIKKYKRTYQRYCDVRALGTGRLPEDYGEAERCLNNFIDMFDRQVIHGREDMDKIELKRFLEQKFSKAYERAFSQIVGDKKAWETIKTIVDKTLVEEND